MLPPLNLADWELRASSSLPRSAPSSARITAYFHGTEQKLLARSIDFSGGFSVVFVRCENDPNEGNWIPLVPSDARLSPWAIRDPLDEWKGISKGTTYGRAVWFGNALAALHPDGRANWYVTKAQEPIPFRWHNGTGNWDARAASEWKDALELELQSPDSDASFAYRWAFLSEWEQRELVWECEGGWDNFYSLLRWMMTAQPDLEMEQRYAIRILNLYYAQNLEFGFTEWSNGDFVDTQVDWIVSWENLINVLFTIHPRRELIERHLCASTKFPLDVICVFYVERKPISHHEKVEALLHLREWVRERGVQMLDAQEQPFDLQPWELGPFAKESVQGFADARITANWLGTPRDFWVRQVEMAPHWYIILARLCDGSEPDNFVVCGRVDEDDDQPSHSGFWKPIGLAPFWSELTESLLLGRLFNLEFHQPNLQGIAVVVLSSNGKGNLSWQDGFSPTTQYAWEAAAVFRWNSVGLERARSAQWLARLQEELDDVHSDVSFAISWLQLSYEERVDALFRCQRGTIAELRDVLQLAMLCEPAFMQKANLSQFSSPDWCWNAWPLERFENAYSPTKWDIPTNLSRWGRAILEWFAPEADAELMQAHPCAESFYHLTAQSLLQVNTAPVLPEQQEKARHSLREWARGKVPDEMLKTLL